MQPHNGSNTGGDGGSGVTKIDYITISSNSSPTATTFGDLTSARYATAGLSDGQ